MSLEAQLLSLLLGLVVLGALLGAGVGFGARTVGLSPAVLGWPVVLVTLSPLWFLGDSLDRGFLGLIVGLMLLGWPLGGIAGEWAYRRRKDSRPDD